MTSRPDQILTLWQGVEFLSPRALPKTKPPTRGEPFEPIVYDLYENEPLPWDDLNTRPFAQDPKRRWKHVLYVGVMGQEAIHTSLEAWRQGPGADYAGVRKDQKEQLTALFAVAVDDEGRSDLSSLELAEFPWFLGRLKPERFTVPTVAKWESFKAHAKEEISSALTKQAVCTMQQLTQAAHAYVELAGWTPHAQADAKPWARCKSVALLVDKHGHCDPINTEFSGSHLSADRLAIESRRVGSALASYLGMAGSSAVQRVDLETDTGALQHALSPQNMPHACWPAPGKHPLVLAQQAAVNLAIQDLSRRDGLFAVNGPPGTGKTTLVRDIVAAVITQRAEALSRLRHPVDAFKAESGDAALRAKPGFTLIKDLTGFELVVASSNNGAVENVTHKLPLADAIDPSWSGACDYFSDIACRLARPTGKSDTTNETQSAGSCWAHLAATLGNSKKNSLFWKGFASADEEGEPNMFDWLKNPPLPPDEIKDAWKNALQAFAKAKADVTDRIATLQEVERVVADIADIRRAEEKARREARLALQQFSAYEEAYRQQSREVDGLEEQRARAADGGKAMQAASVLNQLQEAIAQSKARSEQLRRDLTQATSESAENKSALARCTRDIADIKDDEQRADKRKPWFWARWMRTAPWQAWVANIEALQQRLNEERAVRGACEAKQSALELRILDVGHEKKATEAALDASMAEINAAERQALAARAQAESVGFDLDEPWESITATRVEEARKQFSMLLERCVQAKKILAEGKMRCSEMQRQATQAQARAEQARDELAAAEKQLSEARALMGTNLPDQDFWAQDDAARHLAAPWAHEALHSARVSVFLAALHLHKAFILGARQKILQSLKFLKDNYWRAGAADARGWRSLWSTFFLVTPVVSTTFASMGRLFAGLEENALGWLIVDEAGQATPQAPVGSLWRARRALVVGDPMQIAPITSLDPDILNGIGRRMGVDDAWNPSVQSAQLLADRASKFGALVDIQGEQTWVGCPLRVHRRCLDPMFRIANAIAYEGRMVAPPLPPAPPSPLGETRWIDIRSLEADSHYIPQEGFAALSLLERAFATTPSGLPSLSVITPFSHVKERLDRLCMGLKDPRVKAWLRASLGTVHTFQGKESKAVIIVLGGHPERAGALRWASRTPNLLNVAVTRAQQHLYVIGDRTRWRKMENFGFLARALPSETLGGKPGPERQHGHALHV